MRQEPQVDVLVVGAGFAGSVMAEQLASAGKQVLLIDRRAHLGGNAYDEYDEHGVLIHTYGPHIFHTNSRQVFDYLSRFTDWRAYEHRVLAKVGQQLVPIPINRTTINRLYGLRLDERGVTEFFERVRERRNPIRTSEDVVLNSVGRDLCEKLFRGYTRKQWGLDLSELSPAVAARIPTRTNDDDRYFSDIFQAMPRNGYTKMFVRLLEHPNIRLRLATDFAEIKNAVAAKHVVYTGPVDAYFNYCHGKLPYRSLYFEHKHWKNRKFFQPVGTVNYPDEFDFTRISEFKHVTGQAHSGTSIVKEFPQAEGEPYYPIPCPENDALYRRYHALTEQERDVTFVGRLAEYRYYNMDRVVKASLNAAKFVVAKLDADR